MSEAMTKKVKTITNNQAPMTKRRQQHIFIDDCNLDFGACLFYWLLSLCLVIVI
jgi:hypothetical protein